MTSLTDSLTFAVVFAAVFAVVFSITTILVAAIVFSDRRRQQPEYDDRPPRPNPPNRGGRPKGTKNKPKEGK